MSVGTSLDRHIAVVRTGVLAGSLIFAFGLFGSSAALAQNCGMAGPLIAPAAAWSAGIAISNAITAANTAFLGQSTAFVSAPGNPKANSEGAGIWIRGVGGELTTNSSAHVVQAITTAPNRTLFFSGPCNDQFHQTFGGFQLGTDMAKLNVGGWNLTLGPTAGFLQTNGNIVGGNSVLGTSPFNSTTQAPFVGTYGHASYGNFFVDGIVRADYFQTVLNSPAGSQLILNPVSGALVPTAAINFANQRVDTHGFTVAASTGYNWQVPNSSWFIEPSAGVIWSREAVDPFGVAGQTGALTSTPQNPNVFASGTVKVNDIESIMGRAGLRVGTTMETSDVVYSPFVAASVWHDFGSRITTNWGLCPGCDFGMPVTSSMSSNNVGTFGQYSVGVSGQVKNTGWLGFARVDLRDGPQMHGLSGTGGIRYQFNPTATARPVKAKAPADVPVDWAGWYGGVIGGATEFAGASQTLQGAPGAFPLGPSSTSTTADMRPSGWLGGGTLGYNFQTGQWVLGIEGDIAGTSTNGATQCAPLVTDPNNGFLGALLNTTCHDSADWFATATARFGYAWTPRSLLYVKAGGAFTDEKASVQCNFGSTTATLPDVGTANVPGALGQAVFPLSCQGPNFDGHTVYQASTSAFRAGWTIGIGSEFALTNHWSIKGEFDWLDFGSKSLTLSDGTPLNSTLHVAEAKIGINYKFWPAGPDSSADLALPVIKPASLTVKAAPAAVSTWDGFYLGGSVGWEGTSSKWNTTCFPFNGNCGAGNPFFADASNPHTFDTSGARIGTYFGINRQVAPAWLVGVEADVGFNDNTSQVTGIVGCTTSCGAFVGGTPVLDSTSVRTSWDGSLRGRAGYLVNPAFLVYGTGGFAERMIDASATCNGAFSPWCANNESQTYTGHLQTGWTAGGGIEWKARNNVVLRGEYRYSDYGTWSPTFFAGTGDEIRTNISGRAHMALFGGSYLFAPAGPAAGAHPAPLPVKATPAAGSTWDGFYLGGSVGWERTSSLWNTTCLLDCTAQTPFVADASNRHSLDTSGTRIGGHFGVNWQVAPTWLVGVEADVGFNDKTSKVTGIVGCTTSCGAYPPGAIRSPALDSTSVRTSWDGSLRARAGYLVTPAFLMYGTGGFAERMIDANVTCTGVTSPWCTSNENQTYAGHLQAGWTAGGGLEWKVLSNVLLRGEYRYSDYGSWAPAFFPAGLDAVYTNISSHTHMALFGASYLFGGTPVK